MIILVNIMMLLAIIFCAGGIYCAVKDQQHEEWLERQNKRLKRELEYLTMEEQK